MLKRVLKDICNNAHKNGLKAAVHATSIKSVKMAVDCGADILLHVPMKETFPKELADTIAKKRDCCRAYSDYDGSLCCRQKKWISAGSLF